MINLNKNELILKLEEKLEKNGYRMEFFNLLAGVEYIIECNNFLNEYTIENYIKDTIENYPELLIEI